MVTPEIFTFAGIIVFVVLSLVTYYLRSSLPKMLPFVYQLVAAGGLGQMYFTNFSVGTSIGTRNVLSLIYFIIAITNMIGLSILATNNKH